LSQTLGYVPSPQTKISFSQTKLDLFDEVNFELSKEELHEAIALSGYTKKDKLEVTEQVDNTKLTNTGRMWACALMGIWKTVVDVHGWVLPATFDKYSICGKGFFKICSIDNFTRRFVYHCGRIGCEICAKRAGARASKKIERRIWLYGLKIKHETKGRRNPLSSHVIEAIDPKDDFWNWTNKKQIETLKKIRKLAGISGGAEINHLWAFDKLDLKPFYRPHKHLIAYGWIKSNASELIKKKFGVTLVYFKVRNGTLRSRIDVFAVAFYQLSHASVKHNKHSIKWFGDLAYNKVSNKTLKQYIDEEYGLQDKEIERTKHCPFCGKRIVPAKINEFYKDWKHWIPPPEELENGCVFQSGLFVSVDFVKGEKIPYYDENYEVTYRKTKKEKFELKKLERPDLYDKKTVNEKLDVFVIA